MRVPPTRTGKRTAAARASMATFRRAARAHNRNPAFQSVSRGVAEKKNIDTPNIAIQAFGVTTGIIQVLNNCTAGALPTNRIGRRITMKSVLVRGQFHTSPTTAGSCSIRCLIVYDKQTNKTAPGATDILATDDIASPATLANSHRFTILRDIWVPCVGSAGPQSVMINEYIKCNLETEYIDGVGAGTTADITSGGLFMLVYTNNATATAAVVASNLNTRVRFQDM